VYGRATLTAVDIGPWELLIIVAILWFAGTRNRVVAAARELPPPPAIA
jgi:hypothetical protein